MIPDRSGVERALDEIRPHLHGGVELVAILDGEVRVRFSGRCADCTLQAVTLRAGVERVLIDRVPGVRVVSAVSPPD